MSKKLSRRRVKLIDLRLVLKDATVDVQNYVVAVAVVSSLVVATGCPECSCSSNNNFSRPRPSLLRNRFKFGERAGSLCFLLKTLLATTQMLRLEPGWRSGYRASLEIKHKRGLAKRQDSWWASCSQGFESLPRRHQHIQFVYG